PAISVSAMGCWRPLDSSGAIRWTLADFWVPIWLSRMPIGFGIHRNRSLAKNLVGVRSLPPFAKCAEDGPSQSCGWAGESKRRVGHLGNLCTNSQAVSFLNKL